MDVQQQLFGLMAVAQEQQKAVTGALEGLSGERAALAQAVARVVGAAGEVHLAATAAVPALQQAVDVAVGRAVRHVLADEARTALREATQTVIEPLAGAAQAARDAERALRRAGAWFAWKWVAVAAGGLMGVCLIAYGALAWQRHQVADLAAQKDALAAEVAQMQANVDALAKRGGRITLAPCGLSRRLCVRVDTHAGGFGKDGDYRILRSY